jgi:hypothetical protein
MTAMTTLVGCGYKELLNMLVKKAEFFVLGGKIDTSNTTIE